MLNLFSKNIFQIEKTGDIKINMTPYVKYKWCSDNKIFLNLLQDACSDKLLTQFQETIQIDAEINKTVGILSTALGRAGKSIKLTQRKMRLIILNRTHRGGTVIVKRQR